MEELNEKKKSKYKIIRIIIQIILIVGIISLLIFSTIKLFPIFTKIQNDEAYRDIIVDKIKSYGWLSFFIVLGAQILQAILAIIPSGPIVIISGILFHPVLAIIICLVGQTIGAVCVYYLVKQLGVKFIALFIDPDKIKNFSILKNRRQCEVLMFGYLLIPGLPKDIISFVAPFTQIKIKSFILITLIARIPMTIVSVLMGSSLLNGSYTLAIILGSISLILALLCFIFNKKIVLYLEKKQEEKMSA